VTFKPVSPTNANIAVELPLSRPRGVDESASTG